MEVVTLMVALTVNERTEDTPVIGRSLMASYSIKVTLTWPEREKKQGVW